MCLIFLAISNIFRNTKKSWNLISIDNKKYFCRSCQCWFCSYQWNGLNILKVFKHKSSFCVMIHSCKRMISSKEHNGCSHLQIYPIFKNVMYSDISATHQLPIPEGSIHQHNCVTWTKAFLVQISLCIYKRVKFFDGH